MLFTAFRPQTTREIKKVTSSDRSEAKWRDLLFYSAVSEMLFDRESWAFGPPKQMKNRFHSATALYGAPPTPLSSRGAKPRDLQFSWPLVEMFFDRADPDFLLRNACDDHVKVSHRRCRRARLYRLRKNSVVRGTTNLATPATNALGAPFKPSEGLSGLTMRSP
jgi:hypothetical protein